jgi:hypothetical protein
MVVAKLFVGTPKKNVLAQEAVPDKCIFHGLVLFETTKSMEMRQ